MAIFTLAEAATRPSRTTWSSSSAAASVTFIEEFASPDLEGQALSAARRPRSSFGDGARCAL